MVEIQPFHTRNVYNPKLSVTISLSLSGSRYDIRYAGVGINKRKVQSTNLYHFSLIWLFFCAIAPLCCVHANCRTSDVRLFALKFALTHAATYRHRLTLVKK